MSCPAVTGAAEPACELTDGGEHRCARLHDRSARYDYVHRCGCGYRWTCLNGTIDELLLTLGVK